MKGKDDIWSGKIRWTVRFLEPNAIDRAEQRIIEHARDPQDRLNWLQFLARWHEDLGRNAPGILGMPPRKARQRENYFYFPADRSRKVSAWARARVVNEVLEITVVRIRLSFDSDDEGGDHENQRSDNPGKGEQE